MKWRTFFVLLVAICFAGAMANRVKRHLVFTKGTRLFFVVDVRDNLFDYYKFLAHAFGIKMDWDLPESPVHDSKNGRIQRRDLHEGIKNFLHRMDINGTLCVEKFVCEALVLLPRSNNFLAQLYEILFGPAYDDHSKTKESCEKMLGEKNTKNCPLSITSIAHVITQGLPITIKYK